MASSGYYDGVQSTSSYRYRYSQPASSFHLCLFLATASLLGAASLYSRCESAMESLFDQIRVVVVLSPLLLLLAAQYYWVAASSGRRPRGAGSPLSLPMGESSWYVQQRDGAGASSPWGVALVLALVLLLISYQSCLQDLWFPPIGRRRARSYRCC